jgi:5-methylcytosine-specific restriction protein A
MILKGIDIYKQRTSKGYNGSKDSFYQTKEWKSYRRTYLMTYPLCKLCSVSDKVTLATVLDHIVPIKKGGAKWDYNNLQGLCTHHNAIKTALDNPNNGFDV